jgi:hypothetical protein
MNGCRKKLYNIHNQIPNFGVEYIANQMTFETHQL